MTASFFLEMGWKSALIAGAALMLAWALRNRPPADRALVLRTGIAMLLALPLIALLLPALQIEAWAAPEAAPVASFVASQAALVPLPDTASYEAVEPTIWDDPTPLVILAYLGGLLMGGGRLAAGLWTLGRWTRAALPVTDPDWLDALDRVRHEIPGAERVRLLVSGEVPAPLSWGWHNPVILIDPDSLDLPEDAEAILAHELSHVARRDWPALMLSRLAAALFWFNPLVWRLEREVVQQAEEAADFDATDRVEPTHYAQTLLSWAQADPLLLPAHSVAPHDSALARRVRAVLERGSRQRPGSAAWTAIALVLCVGFAAPVAAVELIEAAPPPLPPAAPVAPAPLAAPSAPAAPKAVPAPPAPPEAVTNPAAPAPVALAPTPLPKPAPLAPVAPVAAVAAVAQPAHVAPPVPPRPPRHLVDVDDLVAMRIQGVTADYLAELAAASPRLARLSPEKLIEMRIHGVSASFIRAMADAGYDGLSANQLVTMRIHGVTPGRARRAIRIEGRRPSAERLIEMVIHGEL